MTPSFPSLPSLPSFTGQPKKKSAEADIKKPFDPNGVGIRNGNIFGFTSTFDDAQVVILPVPWEVTTSYKPGTAEAAQNILEASTQLDFFDIDVPRAWQTGIYMSPITTNWHVISNKLRKMAAKYIAYLENGNDANSNYAKSVTQKIHQASVDLNEWVKTESLRSIRVGKIPAVLGGDHSSPLGLLEALAAVHNEFAILQIDAHADLRKAYEGFTHSHASIMYNALELPSVSRLVSVGIRDISPNEALRAAKDDRIAMYYDAYIKEQTEFTKQSTFNKICDNIIDDLYRYNPNGKVYISFDIDGLQPAYCPNTGTPVPGGLSYNQAIYLLKKIHLSDLQIIGFDLCEVGKPINKNDDWDANVAARLLYKLCIYAGYPLRNLATKAMVNTNT